MGDFADPTTASALEAYPRQNQEQQLDSAEPGDTKEWHLPRITVPHKVSNCQLRDELSSEAAIAFPKALLSSGSGDCSMQDDDDSPKAASGGWKGTAEARAESASTSNSTVNCNSNKDKAASDGPNKFPSASNLATKSSCTIAKGDDVDVIAKGGGRQQQQDGEATRTSVHALASAPQSSSSSTSSSSGRPSPAPIQLAFLDKVAAPFGPRSQTISPYGSAHPLYLAAKKYRLKVDQSDPSSSKPTAQSASASSAAAPASSSKAFCSPDERPKSPISESRATVSPELPKNRVEAAATSKQEHQDKERDQKPLQASSPPPEDSSDMGSTRTASTRIHRRPSPLDVPAPSAKRRRSNGGSFHVVKVEETENDTMFLISSGHPGSIACSSTSHCTESLPSSATILHPQDPPQKDLSRSCAETKTSANRPASPATSVDLRSSIADEDCECFIEELRTPNIRVPRQLPRPAIVQEMDYSNLQLDPSLKDVPMPYILDNITLKGSALLSTVVQSSIALPSSSSLASTPPSRPAIPRTVAVRTPLRLLDQAALPEYVLAVTNDETDKVMFLPVHGLVLAASSKSFAGLAQPPTVDTPSTEEGEDTIRISPVVHIHLPSSAAFSRLVPFFYTQDSGSLLASLLPLQHLPNMSLHAAQSSPSLLADHLAQLDQQLLTQYVYLNHSMWRTAVALGAGRDELWKVLQASWVALVTALSVQHSKSRVKIEDSKSSSPI